MENIPNLDDLLDYGEEYQYPDLIMSDYFRIDNSKVKENKSQSQPEEQTKTPGPEQQLDKPTQEQDAEQQPDKPIQEQGPERQVEEPAQEQSPEQQPEEPAQEQGTEQQADKPAQEQSPEQQVDKPEQGQGPERQTEEPAQEQGTEQQAEKPAQEQGPEQQPEEPEQEQGTERQTEEPAQEQSPEQQTDKPAQEQGPEQQPEEPAQEQGTEQQVDKPTQEQDAEQQPEEPVHEQGAEQEPDKPEQEPSTDEENDFDDLMDNYDERNRREQQDNEGHKETHSASDKLDDITSTEIYRVLKKLVSLSYERYQKGSYRYNKKEIVKHYLTNQRFRIIDDLESPTFKPDVYVFDLSPSNNESLEMYVNAISSVAVKNSIIYLTYNDCILRKLVIKKENVKNLDVSKIVNSEVKSYSNFDCIIFNEYRSLYEELRDIKDRTIYIFSDFDISSDISRLSQENPSIVWFSTEKSYESSSFFYREYPRSYIGYYVETSGIEDIERFVKEKNKKRYKRRFM